MAARRLRQDAWSEAWEHPARDDLDFPLMVERTRPHLASAGVLPFTETQLRTLAALPPPFRPIIDVKLHEGSVEVIQQRFLGVAGWQLLHALRKSNRLLPLDVWLGLAQGLCTAWSFLPPDGAVSRLVPSPERFGVDLRNQFLVFPDANQSMAEELVTNLPVAESLTNTREYASPELLANGRHDARGRVFSLGLILAELLTSIHPMRGRTRFDTTTAISTGEARWDSSTCPPALAGVLRASMNREPLARPASPRALLDELLAAAKCTPASAERIGHVVLGAAPERWRIHLVALRDEPAQLPLSWRHGGLAVLEDQLLEALVPIERLPSPKGSGSG